MSEISNSSHIHVFPQHLEICENRIVVGGDWILVFRRDKRIYSRAWSVLGWAVRQLLCSSSENILENNLRQRTIPEQRSSQITSMEITKDRLAVYVVAAFFTACYFIALLVFCCVQRYLRKKERKKKLRRAHTSDMEDVEFSTVTEFSSMKKKHIKSHHPRESKTKTTALVKPAICITDMETAQKQVSPKPLGGRKARAISFG